MSHQFGLDDLAWIALGVLIVALAPNVPAAARWFMARYVASRADDYVEWDGGSGDDDTGSGTGSRDPVLRQQNQAEPEPVLDFATVLDYLTRHKIDDQQAVDILAVLRRGDDYLMSANKIRDVVGGADAPIKARVATHRPRNAAPQKTHRLERPVNGW